MEIDSKEIQLPNAQFLPHVCELVAEGHTVSIRAKGSSMRPFIESGRDIAVISKADAYKVKDVVLAEISPGHYVMHRIDKIELPRGGKPKTPVSDPEAWIVLRGDGNPRGTEACQLKNLHGVVSKWVRKGQEVSTDSKKWKIYSALWVAARPARRYLLAIYRLLWLHELPNRWKKKK